MEAEHVTDVTCGGDPTRREGTERIWMAEYIRSTEVPRTKVHRTKEGGTTLYAIPSPFLSCFQYQEGRGINHDEKDPRSATTPAKFIEDT